MHEQTALLSMLIPVHRLLEYLKPNKEYPSNSTKHNISTISMYIKAPNVKLNYKTDKIAPIKETIQ